MSNKKLLIIFIKNEEKGKVKTRLAKTIGEDKALEVYQKLLDKTRLVTQELKGVDKVVYYSNHIADNDRWPIDQFDKAVQYPGSLGERMTQAFCSGFSKGYKQICIIGSDCWDLDTVRLREAFDALDHHDFVAGAANDGGYYLLGMSYFLKELFKDKTFSTDSVYEEAITEIKKTRKPYKELSVLTDIDDENDLKQTSLWGKMVISESEAS